jgi:hypothetical protein
LGDAAIRSMDSMSMIAMLQTTASNDAGSPRARIAALVHGVRVPVVDLAPGALAPLDHPIAEVDSQDMSAEL